MPLMRLENVDLAFGTHIIFDQVNLQLNKGDRIGLIGRNGEGKSTLLKTLFGSMEVDGGSIYRHPDLKIAQVAQVLPPATDQAVEDYVAEGGAAILADLAAYDQLSQDPNVDMQKLTHLQHSIDAADGWNFAHQLKRILENFELDKGQKLSDLSGGWRRKAALARALVTHPDVLLLDEPTNHLDIGLISWLEKFIVNFTGAVVIITHDRAFLRAVSNQIAELDRGHLVTWQGTYGGFLDFKEQQLKTEEKHNALFDKRLAQEEAWIRGGIKARRTRNEGRVRALKKMRAERGERRVKSELGNLQISTGGISGKLVAEIKAMSFAFDGNPIVSNFSSFVLRGDKIGLIGPNGVGKSTFLKLLLGELTPDSGELKSGTQIKVAYFDQMRDQIDMNANIVDNVGEGRLSVEVNGQEKHILSYLQDFMFSPERARTPLKALSGGECSRVMLAKLFCKPSNLLIMDEPTNDLDTETLELLETLLVQYTGTVFLVSHDREFLDNVVTSSIVFEGNGKLQEYVGGYQDWLHQGGSWEAISGGAQRINGPDEAETLSASKVNKTAEPAVLSHADKSAAKKADKKLSYKLQRELDKLPKKIEALETKIEEINACMCAEDFYQQSEKDVADTLKRLADTEKDLQAQYDRWEELESQL